MSRTEEFSVGMSHQEFEGRLRQSIGLRGINEGRPKKTRNPRSGFMGSVGREQRLVPGSSPPEVRILEHGHYPGRGHVERNIKLSMNPEEVGRKPLRHVYRAVSEAEYDFIQKHGVIHSDQRANICQTEGTCAEGLMSPHPYLPATGTGRILKIRVHPDDGWHVDPRDGYVKTTQPIPAERIVRATPPITRKDTRVVRWG